MCPLRDIARYERQMVFLLSAVLKETKKSLSAAERLFYCYKEVKREES